MITVTTNTRAVYPPKKLSHPLWSKFAHYKGISLILENGVWTEVEYADADRIAAATLYLQGGLAHSIDNSYATTLIASGFQANITWPDGGGYGIIYGEGGYGV